MPEEIVMCGNCKERPAARLAKVTLHDIDAQTVEVAATGEMPICMTCTHWLLEMWAEGVPRGAAT